MLRRTALAISVVTSVLVMPPVGATHGQPHATIKYWDVGNSAIGGYDPHETIEDIGGVTGHVATPAAPLTLVTSMENGGFGYCGPMFWNPATNDFKVYQVTFGLQTAVDVNREAPVLTNGSRTFQPGDTWMTVYGSGSHGIYVNLRNSDEFRRYEGLPAFSHAGIRVNQDTGRVYAAAFDDGRIVELDPATNNVRTWSIGNHPYWLDLDPQGRVYTAAAADFTGIPDQVVRLDPGTGEVVRWNIPGGGLQPYVGFGMANGVRLDPAGNLWFSQTDVDIVSRLRVAANEIDQYSKPGLDDPNGIAASGSGASLQAFFTERNSNHISLITAAGATPTTVAVPPVTSTVLPASPVAIPVDFTIQPLRTTIGPVTFDSPGVDPPGIVRFPAPLGPTGPAGISRVAEPRTIYGSFEGSDHVFRLESEAIIAPPANLNAAAEGYTVRAQVPSVPLDTGKIPRAYVDGPPNSDVDTILHQDVAEVGTSVGIGDSTAFAGTEGEDQYESVGSSRVVGVSVASGAVRAEKVRAVSKASFTRDVGGTTSSDGSGFVNLVVNGVPITDGIPPNTTIPIPGVGEVRLREEIPVDTGDLVSLQVNMIHVVVDAGADVIVSAAFAAAGAGAAAPLDAGLVLPPPPPPPDLPDVNPVPLSENFEGGAPGWTIQGTPSGEWQIGAPTSGPGAAHGGSNVAATQLGGPYHNGANAGLVSPTVDLSAYTPDVLAALGKSVVLRFWHFFQTETYYDCGVVVLHPPTGPPQTVDPEGGYPYTGAYCGGKSPPKSYSGFVASAWTEQLFDLTAYAGTTFNLAWEFATDSSVTAAGWFVDDVEVVLE